MNSGQAATGGTGIPRPPLRVAGDVPRHWTPAVEMGSEREEETVGKRVLVVDDDVAIRILLRTYLTRSGLQVDLASDGADAIDKLRSAPYDAVITDLMMPVTDGIGVVAFMEEEQPELLRRTIVLTAYPQLAMDRQLNDKVIVYSKPFDLNSLGKLLASLSEAPST
jgi:CheY-like chemotaxis protein